MRIAIFGFMGSGKSVLGELLAEKMRYPFIDLDKEIEQKTNLSISQIFEKKGEIEFRKTEHKTLKEIINKDFNNIIISLGGGTIIRPDNRKILTIKNYKTIYLNVSVKELTKRLKQNNMNRPLLKDIKNNDLYNYVKALHNTRKFLYEKYADIKINIENEDITSCLEKIYLYLNVN